MNYNPSQIPLEDDEIKDWIFRELNKISMTLNESNAIDKSFAIRGRLFDGRIMFLDKSISPDGSTGVFIYYENKWHRMG